jgi:hypothetical protein
MYGRISNLFIFIDLVQFSETILIHFFISKYFYDFHTFLIYLKCILNQLEHLLIINKSINMYINGINT